MKRVILFTAIVFGFASVALAQTTEKVKTKIEGQGFKKKTKTEGEPQKVLTSVSAHQAYAHHYRPAYNHHYRTVHHHATARRHTAYQKRHVTHKRPILHRHVLHYKKIKREHKNGESKVKYKT
jgi:hypothetical protein